MIERTWSEWVRIIGKKEGWTTAIRDFGSSYELMTKEKFLNEMRGQTVTAIVQSCENKKEGEQNV